LVLGREYQIEQKSPSILDDTQSQLVLPLIALAEAAFIVERGRTSISSVGDLLPGMQSAPHLELYPLTPEVFEQSLLATNIPEIHDRLIVATALYLQSVGYTVSLITADSVITASKLVPVV
jgi:PIN domain nuclease of toxin-antitoxin system